MFEKKFSLSFWEAVFLCLLWIMLPFLVALFIALVLIPVSGGFDQALFKFYELLNIPLTTAFMNIFVMIIFILLLRLRKDDVFDIKWFGNVSFSTLMGTVVMIVGLNFLLSEVTNIVNYFFPMTPYWHEVFIALQNKPTIIYFIEAVLIAAIVEEFLIRGIIARGLNERFSKGFTIVVASFLFAIIHLNIWQFFSAFLAGIILTWLFLKTESLLLVIFAHGLYNSMPLVVTRGFKFGIPGYNEVGVNMFEGQPIQILVIAAVLFIIGFLVIKLKQKENIF